MRIGTFSEGKMLNEININLNEIFMIQTIKEMKIEISNRKLSVFCHLSENKNYMHRQNIYLGGGGGDKKILITRPAKAMIPAHQKNKV